MLSFATLPPRMVMRALDDLHALATAARSLPEIEVRILDRVAEIQTQFDQALSIGRSLEERGGELQRLGEQLNTRAGEFLALAGTLESAVTSMDEVNRSAEAMAAVAEPLHGAAERLGRIVDRLPGGQRPPRP